MTSTTDTNEPVSFVAWQAFPEHDHRFGKMRPVGSSRDREGMAFLAGPRGTITEHASAMEASRIVVKGDARTIPQTDTIEWTYLGDGNWTSGKARNCGEPVPGEYHASHHDPKGEECTLTFPDGSTFTGTSRECRNRAEAHKQGQTA